MLASDHKLFVVSVSKISQSINLYLALWECSVERKFLGIPVLSFRGSVTRLLQKKNAQVHNFKLFSYCKILSTTF